MSYLQRLLNRSRIFFIAWSMLAAFGTYFCMYAFRKPFNAGTYEGLELWGIHYKTVLIIAQVLGYMLSKFACFKVISELKARSRKKLIIGLILFAETALLLFGLVPHTYSFIFLFLNGLPLGMVWGIVFSYLEGRRFTEILAMGLSTMLSVIPAPTEDDIKHRAARLPMNSIDGGNFLLQETKKYYSVLGSY